jgi:TonB family protein
MRITISLALLYIAAPAYAQSVIGVTADSASNEPLRCVDVALEDSASHVLAWSSTGDEGTFRFDSATTGAHHIRFTVWHHRSIVAPLAAPSATDGSTPRYRLSFEANARGKPKLWPDTTDSPPGRMISFPAEGMRYPPDLRKKRIEGGVVTRYVLDATGFVDPTSIRILESSDPEFSNAATKFLQQIQLAPARRGGKPVCALVWQQPFNFNVKN